MCTSPLHIENKRKRFIPSIDKEILTVPCGKCLECRNARRNELYVEAYYEHLQAVTLGGFTQFFTLTYNEESVPKFNGRNCFSSRNVKLYIERLTSACKRKFGNDFSFRYLVVSEQDSSGIRDINPHHHVLFFVQRPCNHHEFRELCRCLWPYGWSFGSWDNFGEVNRPSGIRYVTKYVCKNVSDLKSDEKYIRSFSDLKVQTQAKKTLPFVRHSQKFGYFAIQHIMEGDSLLPKRFQTSFDYIKKFGRIFVPCDNNGTPGTIIIPRNLLRILFMFPTYRYKRITQRDIMRCQKFGLPIPKHKVQTYYIPKPDYYDYYVSKLHRQVAKANDIRKALLGSNNYTSSTVALGLSVFSDALINSSLTFEDYVDSCARISMIRDPIFERDPFDGSFSYRRAPLERTFFPDLERFVKSDYCSSEYLDSLKQDIISSRMKSVKQVSDSKIEKTCKDISVLCHT